MKKPRAFVHFEQTYTHDMMGVLAIGKLRIPTSVLLVFTALVWVVLTVLSGVLAGITGNAGWWNIIIWFGLIVGSLSVLGGLTSLVTWMGRTVINANTATTVEHNGRGY